MPQDRDEENISPTRLHVLWLWHATVRRAALREGRRGDRYSRRVDPSRASHRGCGSQHWIKRCSKVQLESRSNVFLHS